MCFAWFSQTHEMRSSAPILWLMLVHRCYYYYERRTIGLSETVVHT